MNTTYDTTAELLLFEEAFWFVADTGRERNGIPVWALYREVNGTRQEMIEGVEHMQVKFGQRLALSDSIRYVDPSDTDLNSGLNYEGVISVRVALLLQGFDLVRNGDDDRSYVLIDELVAAPGEATGAQGGRHGGAPVQRDAFTTTIRLRNAPEI